MSDPKSISDDQDQILQWIIDLHCKDGFDVDATYGNGQFYKKIPKPRLRYDLDESLADCAIGSSTCLPIGDKSVGSIVFDPPFLTYVRAAREGNGKMVMAKRFSGYWRYDELEAHYRDILKEFSRCLRPKGIVVFKCQDIIHNHKMHATHINVVNWASDIGFRLKDMFILCAKHRMPRPNKGAGPKHARVFHSYFLILEKVS